MFDPSVLFDRDARRPAAGPPRRAAWALAVIVAIGLLSVAVGGRACTRELSFGAEDTGRTLRLDSTAYNSLPGQTQGDPTVAAWGDPLYPGLRAVAVSRDLLDDGLVRRGTRLRIDGLDGEWVVLDKMHRRHRRRIDLYLGEDVDAARAWGRREVTVTILDGANTPASPER
ncbi:MAG: hypothetical protein AAGN46_14805 [Acidobacteriota bacterium]